jgi:hypothetical protein
MVLSCGLLAGAAAAATPPEVAEERRALNVTAFERLKSVILERYSHRDLHDIDWEARFDRFRAPLLTAEGPEAFAKRAAVLLQRAHDPHLWLQVAGDDDRIMTARRLVWANFDAELLAKTVPELTQVNAQVAHGRWPADGIGYLQINTWDQREVEALQAIAEALNALQDTEALILDVRLNGGGSELIAQRVAGAFLQEEVLYAKSRIRDPDAPDGFSPLRERTVKPNPVGPYYHQPLAVLIGPACLSANEAFILMLKQHPDAKFFGLPTGGSSGNPQPYDLGNGVTVYAPIWEAFDAAGEPFEGKGLRPDVVIRWPRGGLAKRQAEDPTVAAARAYLLRRLAGAAAAAGGDDGSGSTAR